MLDVCIQNAYSICMLKWFGHFYSEFRQILKSNQSPNYIPHIDGIRAIAIIAIILFHTGLMRTGVLGVNIFFAISGYFLIRGVLSKERKHQFKIFSFFESRITRLFPPMVIVICAVLLFAPCFVLSHEYQVLGEQSFAALTGWANVYLDQYCGGYWNPGSSKNLLMHLWYLSATIQLIIFVTLIIHVLHKRQKLLVAVLIVISALSLLCANHFSYAHIGSSSLRAMGYECICQFLSALFPGEIFTSVNNGYLWFLSRIWAFCAGGLALLLPDLRIRIQSLLSVAAILACFFCFSRGTAGIYGVITVLSTVILIRYGSAALVAPLLSFTPLCAVGKISFSLYLVHWPLIALLQQNNFRTRYILLAEVTILPLCAVLLYLVAERTRWKRWWVFSGWLISLIISLGIIFTEGAKDFIHASINHRYEQSEKNVLASVCRDESYLADYPQKILQFGRQGPGNIKRKSIFVSNASTANNPLFWIGEPSDKAEFVLMGDSHAGALYSSLDAFAKEHDASGLYLNAYVIPFWDYLHSYIDAQIWDKQRAEALLAWLKVHPEIKTVIIAQRWKVRAGYSRSWNLEAVQAGEYESVYRNVGEFCHRLNDIGKRVVILTQAPLLPCPNRKLSELLRENDFRGIATDRRDFTDTESRYTERNKEILKGFDALLAEGKVFRIIHMEDGLFIDGSFCALKEDRFLMQDDDHLSAEGARRCIENHRKEFLEAILPSGKHED